MPMGAFHDETGRLNYHDGEYALRMDGGGTWHLEMSFWKSRSAQKFAGKRVRIQGVRTGFNVLSVDRIELAIFA